MAVSGRRRVSEGSKKFLENFLLTNLNATRSPVSERYLMERQTLFTSFIMSLR